MFAPAQPDDFNLPGSHRRVIDAAAERCEVAPSPQEGREQSLWACERVSASSWGSSASKVKFLRGAAGASYGRTAPTAPLRFGPGASGFSCTTSAFWFAPSSTFA